MDFSKLDFSTSFYHKSINNGPIDMFFTKKFSYFSLQKKHFLKEEDKNIQFWISDQKGSVLHFWSQAVTFDDTYCIY